MDESLRPRRHTILQFIRSRATLRDDWSSQIQMRVAESTVIIGVKKFFECSGALPKFESSSLANDSNTGCFSHLLATFAPLSLRSPSFEPSRTWELRCLALRNRGRAPEHSKNFFTSIISRSRVRRVLDHVASIAFAVWA